MQRHPVVCAELRGELLGGEQQRGVPLGEPHLRRVLGPLSKQERHQEVQEQS